MHKTYYNHLQTQGQTSFLQNEMEIARRQKPAASAAYGKTAVNGSGRRTFVKAPVQKV